MTTYLGEKAVGVGTIKTYVAVADVLHDNTLVGNGNTEPLGVNTKNIVSQQTLANTISVLNTAIDGQADAIAGKQDKLTAGENITIEDGVISATGGGAGGDYLPLSGGTLTGPLTFKRSGYTDRTLTIGDANALSTSGGFQCGILYPSYPIGIDIGDRIYRWQTIYVTKMNNGADLAVPTEGGTLARIEDIDAVVGDISTALTAILGE